MKRSYYEVALAYPQRAIESSLLGPSRQPCCSSPTFSPGNLADKFRDGDVENLRQRYQHQERGIRFTALDRGEVVGVHAGVEGKRFLGEIAVESQFSHSRAEAPEGGGVAFHSHLAPGVFSHYPVATPHRIM